MHRPGSAARMRGMKAVLFVIGLCAVAYTIVSLVFFAQLLLGIPQELIYL